MSKWIELLKKQPIVNIRMHNFSLILYYLSGYYVNLISEFKITTL